ncbi:hypothetical protein AB6A40_001918 [Gnathostoma spinigerum]|uniref:Uncharacterized protein n=1 Tax=Gnathostoma spinigerum TaxID=75299 RepID=A0ABD6E5C1_9BILA
MRDFYGERKAAKKENVSKNELQRLRNLTRNKGNKSLHPVEVARQGVGLELKERSRKELITQIDRARQSTASMGNYQEILKDERPPKNKGKTHQFAPNERGVADEKKKQLDILNKLSSKKPKLDMTKVNVDRVARQIDADKKTSKGHSRPRQKSAIHRQQHFQRMKKERPKLRRDGKQSMKKKRK